jgi:peroxiredoxin
MDTTQVLRLHLRALGDERLRTLTIVFVIGVAIAGATILLDRVGAPSVTTITLTGDASGSRPRVGGAPPDFTATTVTGEAFRLTDLRGRPIWLTFGASWCADCRAEAPDLQATHERYASVGLALVSIWIDEDAEDVRDYAERAALGFTMIADPTTALASRYRTYGLPTHVFIGPDGTIRAIRLGGLPPAEMDALVGSIIR